MSTPEQKGPAAPTAGKDGKDKQTKAGEPATAKPAAKVRLRLVRNWKGYNAGEVASFAPATAEKLQKAKLAVKDDGKSQPLQARQAKPAAAPAELEETEE